MIPLPYSDEFGFESTIGILDPSISSEINIQAYINGTGVLKIRAGDLTNLGAGTSVSVNFGSYNFNSWSDTQWNIGNQSIYGTGFGVSIPSAGNYSGTISMTATGTLATTAQTNITSVGALNGGSITSGFGAIDIGVDIFRVATHCTEATLSKSHIEYLKSKEKKVFGVLMMSSLADTKTLDDL